MPLLEVDAQVNEERPIELGSAKQHPKLKSNRAIDIRQDLVAQAALPLGFGKVLAGVRCQRDKVSACSFERRECRFQRLEGPPTIGTPVAAEKIDDQRPLPEKVVREHQAPLRIR